MNVSAQDLVTVMGSIAGFLVFFAAHSVVFRRIAAKDAVRWFFILVIFTSIVMVLVGLSWVSSMLFIILACCYFMGVFGLMATSVRIRILSEIARTRGVMYKALLVRYNRDVIVRCRLMRLVASGDIVLEKGKYRGGGRVTFFMVPAFVLKLMKVLYG